MTGDEHGTKQLLAEQTMEGGSWTALKTGDWAKKHINYNKLFNLLILNETNNKLMDKWSGLKKTECSIMRQKENLWNIC